MGSDFVLSGIVDNTPGVHKIESDRGSSRIIMYIHLADGEFTPLNELIIFEEGTIELTQCIDVGLMPDSISEPPMLLMDMLAANATFQGETSVIMLGDVFAVDTINSGKVQ